MVVIMCWERTKEGRAFNAAVERKLEAARRWNALAYRIADGEPVPLATIERLAADVVRTVEARGEAGVALTKRYHALKGRRARR